MNEETDEYMKVLQWWNNLRWGDRLDVYSRETSGELNKWVCTKCWKSFSTKKLRDEHSCRYWEFI